MCIRDSLGPLATVSSGLLLTHTHNVIMKTAYGKTCNRTSNNGLANTVNILIKRRLKGSYCMNAYVYWKNRQLNRPLFQLQWTFSTL